MLRHEILPRIGQRGSKRDQFRHDVAEVVVAGVGVAGVGGGQDSPPQLCTWRYQKAKQWTKKSPGDYLLSRDQRPQGNEQKILELTEDYSFCLLLVVPICPET